MFRYAVGTVAAIARLGVKYYMSRRFNIEEAIMFFSLICWTIDTVLIVITVEKGTNQVPEERRMNMPIDEANRRIAGSKAFLGAW